MITRSFLRLTPIFLLIACSAELRAKPAETTPFLDYPDRLQADDKRAPYDAVWSSDLDHIAAKSEVSRKIYVAPINTDYLNKTRNESGTWVVGTKLSDDDIQSYTSYLRSSFVNAIKGHPESNLVLVETPDDETMTLAISLVELVPTKVAVNAAADVAGVAIPGGKLLVEAGSVGAQAVGGAVAGGTVAFEMKLIQGKTGAVLFEAKDREADPASVIPNYRDFEEYGWSRETADEWSKEFAKLFSTNAGETVGAKSQFSFVPW